jgi:two-component system, chemotaxis family, protein-glutamate methylesterase/glutaminase
MTHPVRILVVDDSALMRKLIPQILATEKSLQVVGTAMDGTFALKKIQELKPDVVTLDLEMPGMSGMQTLREITRQHKTRVIVVSSHTTQGASATFKALALGAFDFVAKPQDASSHMQEVAQELIAKIKTAAQSESPASSMPNLEFRKVEKPRTRPKAPPTRVVAIGISTGGPNAIQYVLSQLPGDFPGTLLIVQHMPEGFTEMFARRLNDCCGIEVKEARSGDFLVAGRALICPGNRHMKVRRMPLGDIAVLTDEARVNGHRPSVDVLFRSVAQEFGARTLAVLMTGMGEDGADGMGAVKAAGGLTIAQSPESCVVHGMPRSAIDRGHAMRVVHLDALANSLQAQCMPENAQVKAAAAAEAMKS